MGLSRTLVDPALPGPTLPTGVNYGTAGLTPCPGACKGEHAQGHTRSSARQSSAAAGEGLGREAGRARRVGRHEPLGLELAEVPPVDVADARAPRRLAVALVAPGGGEILDFGAARGGL